MSWRQCRRAATSADAKRQRAERKRQCCQWGRSGRIDYHAGTLKVAYGWDGDYVHYVTIGIRFCPNCGKKMPRRRRGF